jgi:electron transport complex protein RnfD
LASVGGFIAIVIGKQVFGGVGQNVFNPAMVGRVALLVSFPVPLTAVGAPLPLMPLRRRPISSALRDFPRHACRSPTRWPAPRCSVCQDRTGARHRPVPFAGWRGAGSCRGSAARAGSLGESASLADRWRRRT